MARPKQVFRAPGPEDQDLLSDSKAWMHGRTAYVPLEYWNKAMELGEELDADDTKRLMSQSGTAYVTSVDFNVNEYQKSIAFLEKLIEALRNTSELVPEATNEFPEAYPNSEIAQMLKDVKAIFEESVRLQLPLEAWDE